jgi:hypothetical protein
LYLLQQDRLKAQLNSVAHLFFFSKRIFTKTHEQKPLQHTFAYICIFYFHEALTNKRAQEAPSAFKLSKSLAATRIPNYSFSIKSFLYHRAKGSTGGNESTGRFK